MFLRAIAALSLLVFAFGQCRADEAGDRADRMLKAGDLDRNGKFEFSEAFERWHNFTTTMKVVEGDEDYEERTRNAFPDLMEAMDFLLADTNDDLTLARKELLSFFKLEETGKKPEPSRKKLEAFSVALVNATWETLRKLLDTDKDGVFSRAELDEHYPVDINDECFKAADKDKNGKLDKAEYAVFKVEELQRGILVDFDERGGTVGGAGGTGAEAGDKEAGEEKEPQAEGKKADESRKTESREAKKSRLRVGSTWRTRSLVDRKADDGSGKDQWHYQLATVTAITTKADETTVDWKSVHTNEKGEDDGSGSGSGSRVTYTGKNAKYMPAAKDLVKVTVAAGTFDCELREVKDHPIPGRAGVGKRCVAKFYTAFIDGMPLIVKIECEGITTYELVEFKE